MAAWIPPKERAKLGSIVYSGSQAGTVVTLVVSGWLCDSEFLGGWPSVFYVFGALGFVWCVLWFLLVHDSPETHPTISPAELNHIQSSQDLRKQAKVKNIPWKAIFTAPPMWAGMGMCLGTSFGFFTLLTELPTYLSNIQHFDINSNGLLSALPYLIQWGFSIVWGAIMDVLTRTRVLSLTSVRRVSTGVACYVFSGALIAVGFVNCNPTLAVVAVCVALGFNGAIFSGQYMLEQDIAPNLAGTLVGINNTLSAIAGFIAPVFTGAITNNSETLSSWRIVFLVAAGLSIFTTTFYLVFMSADVQPWNDPTNDNEDNTTTADNSDNRGIQTVIIPLPLPLTLPRLKL
ncbi:putative inorganic phosphate cotransporter [Homarus americanus]|uniref:putative inorganic phosphate cotransporter n=1 Tax=Homarus americanus TaxID=6706 RepID=UPI001C43E866|nr:putative inorganic phosphate cotransporter [Homarus americanus]